METLLLEARSTLLAQRTEPTGAQALAWLHQLLGALAPEFLSLASVDAAFRLHAKFSVTRRAPVAGERPPNRAGLASLLAALLLILRRIAPPRSAGAAARPASMKRQLSDEGRKLMERAMSGTDGGDEAEYEEEEEYNPRFDRYDDMGDAYVAATAPPRGGGGGGGGGIYSAKHIRNQAQAQANAKGRRR